jgi:FixJ family two-component response regulator
MVEHPTVYVVDDDALMRETLVRIIRANGMTVHGFGSARELLAQPECNSDACLVLDVDLPDMNGLSLHEQFGNQYRLPVVFITAFADVHMSVRAMKAGAVDFLQKPFTEQVLVTAIKEGIYRHHLWRQRQAEMDTLLRRYARLTAREREVMAHVVAGQLNKQIAWDLGNAEKTVKVHRARVMEKMEVTSLADLVRNAELIAVARSASPVSVHSASPF